LCIFMAVSSGEIARSRISGSVDGPILSLIQKIF
jgi:hypothetical protein